MNYIVMDLEWNQGSPSEPTKRLMPFEVIEIGAIKLNNKRTMVSEFNELIKPQVYHEMHQITSKLIHLQMKELLHGQKFQDVYKSFREWCGDEFLFCTWGPLDLTELQRNIRYYDLEPLSEGPMPFLDVQKLFSIAYEDSKTRRTLEYAIDFLNIEKDIPFHRAFSDAYYTAKVLEKLDEKILTYLSLDLFHLPKDRKSEVHMVFEGYDKYVSRLFEDKTAAMADKEVASTRCYLCKKNIHKTIKWFTYNNGKHYYAISCCDVHGYMKSKVRIRKGEDYGVYVVKTDKFITAETMEEIREKKERMKEKAKAQRKRQAINKNAAKAQEETE